MAVRGIDEREEKKSYGSIFVLGSVILVVLTLWSFWDDNITRRPWKAFQARFYRLDYQKAQVAYNEEDKKLQAEPAYQELTGGGLVRSRLCRPDRRQPQAGFGAHPSAQ